MSPPDTVYSWSWSEDFWETSESSCASRRVIDEFGYDFFLFIEDGDKTEIELLVVAAAKFLIAGR